MLRYLPLGSTLYLLGGLLSGYGMGRLASNPFSLQALGFTGAGAVLIISGYVALRPLLRYAKQQIKRRPSPVPPSDVAPKQEQATDAVAP